MQPYSGSARDAPTACASNASTGRVIERPIGAVVETLTVVGDHVKGDQQVLEKIRGICATFEGSAESLLQDRPLFHVGRRRFAIFNGDTSPSRPRWNAAGRSVHFLSDPAEREALLQDPRFTRSPHHGDRGWLAIGVDPRTADWQELTELLHAAHEQVAAHR